MKVSVIIPFYRGISFLEDCLQSLTDQTFEDKEIIFICNNAEEGVQSILDAFGKKLTIKVFHLNEKQGVAAARNYGLSVATGDYIYFMDSDDYIANNTLQLLVSKAEETNADFVYGKKIMTWFKRSIFMANFSTQDTSNEEEEEEEEDDGDSSITDSSESTLENNGETDSSSSISDEQLLLDEGSEGESIEPVDPLVYEAARQRVAFNRLISKRKGLRNITVLNQLIRRSVIENNKIRFNENIIFLSDYPFLLQVLEATKGYEYASKAAYIKRKHNDAINMPALSQMKESKSFQEYADTYNYAKGLIQPDGNLRKRIDKKIIQYCVKYYAPKLRTNHNDPQREQNYNTIHEIVLGMDPELVRKYKGYKRRLLKAFCKKNSRYTERIVDRHIKWKKLKRILKNKKAFNRFLYFRYFLKQPLKENWVVCESFFGKNYSDSPKYVFDYLSRKYPGKYRFIWVINDKKTKIPYPHIKVGRFGLRYTYFMARSKYYIFNSRQPEWIKKREGNVFLQTWHGTPLKKLVFDLEDINSATPRYKNQTYNQSRAWDYLIAANQYSSDIFKRCFIYDKVMLETGYPRNDILHYENKDEIARQIRSKLGIPSDKKTILYAPTWRDDEFYTKGKYKFTLQLDLQLLKEKLGSEYVILLRTHYFIADSLDVTGVEDFAYNLSKYDDISELYLISDILITDYSSVFFDYANLKRPMLFFTYDLEKYRDVLRGFYINIEEELPGPLLYTTEEIISAINNIDQIEKQYHQKYIAFYEKFCSWEDGHASQKVAEEVFQLKGEGNEANS